MEATVFINSKFVEPDKETGKWEDHVVLIAMFNYGKAQSVNSGAPYERYIECQLVSPGKQKTFKWARGEFLEDLSDLGSAKPYLRVQKVEEIPFPIVDSEKENVYGEWNEDYMVRTWYNQSGLAWCILEVFDGNYGKRTNGIFQYFFDYDPKHFNVYVRKHVMDVPRPGVWHKVKLS